LPKIQIKIKESRLEKQTELLEKAYLNFHTKYHRERDPIFLSDRYIDVRDKEVVSFIVCSIAYGNVKSIIEDAKKLLLMLGPHPYQTIIEKKFVGKLEGFYHRFTTSSDMERLLLALSDVLKKHKTIENCYLSVFHPQKSSKENLSSFVKNFGSNRFLLPTPDDGSACKRLNMFLRWVARPNDGVDLGLWKKWDPQYLMLPLDTHLMKMVSFLGWTKSKSANWRVVEETTNVLKRIDPKDPIRFDFALCHLSMVGESLETLERRPFYEESPKRKLRSP
jgi:uncharacterized protein (TIGR02757 family)